MAGLADAQRAAVLGAAMRTVAPGLNIALASSKLTSATLLHCPTVLASLRFSLSQGARVGTEFATVLANTL